MPDAAQAQLMEMFKELSRTVAETSKEVQAVQHSLIKIETLLGSWGERQADHDMQIAEIRRDLGDARKEIEETKRQVVALSAKIAFTGAVLSAAIPLLGHLLGFLK